MHKHLTKMSKNVLILTRNPPAIRPWITLIRSPSLDQEQAEVVS